MKVVCVRHAIKEVNAWIEKDDRLDGNIGTLVMPLTY